MKKPKNAVFTTLIVFLLTSCFVLTVPLTGLTEEFTDKDAETLKSDDPDAVIDVIYKLLDLYDEKGKEALKPAIPALIESAERELKLPEDERWNIYDIIKMLSLTGDERTKPLLLNIMSTMGGGGNPFTAMGLLAIGHTVVKDVADSLKSSSPDTRGRASVTLHKMFELDDTGKFFTPEDRAMIRERVVANLIDEVVTVRLYSVIALRSFGDASVINPLEHIEKNDAHKDSGGTYEVRIEATETLKMLEVQ